MLEDELYATLKKKTGLPDEALHGCVNALALVMNRELAQQQYFDMPDVGRLVLGAPKPAGGDPSPTSANAEQQQQGGLSLMQTEVTPPSNFRIRLDKLRLPPAGFVRVDDDFVFVDVSETIAETTPAKETASETRLSGFEDTIRDLMSSPGAELREQSPEKASERGFRSADRLGNLGSDPEDI